MSAGRLLLVCALAAFISALCAPVMASDSAGDGEVVRYEYKVLRFGSLSSLQKDDGADKKIAEVEALLNKAGLEGWEMVNIFAVRTTFDPNVFIAVMKRPVWDHAKDGEVQ
jgi:hypothetical protein